MQKYFIILLFAFLLTTSPVFAQQSFTEVQCNNQGGSCKMTSLGGCENGTQTEVGTCSDTYTSNVCCMPISSLPAVSVSQCQKAQSSGGLGGECLAGIMCADADEKAMCPESGSGVDTYCCVTEETIALTEEESGIATVGAVNIGTKYTPLENIPFLEGTTFESYVQGIYTIGLVLIVLSAVFMLVIGGFTYLTSAGNTSAISSAKHIIYGALLGLILALVSYIVINTINPDLTNLSVSRFNPLAIRNPSAPNVGGGGGGGGGATGNTKACAGGVISIPSSLGKRLTGSSANQICKDIADRLIQLQQNSGISIYVTSSIRTGGAQSSCHKAGNPDSGNCADIGINTSLPLHDSRWDALCTAVGNTPGLQFVNEASNRPACTKVAPFKQYQYSSGAHFHVKFIGP